MNFKKIIFYAGFAYGCLSLLASFVGLIVFLIFSQTNAYTYVQNNYISIWLCSVLFFYAAQTIHLLFKQLKYIVNLIFYIDLMYFLIVSVMSFILFVLYCPTGKGDAVAWSFFVFFTNVINCAILIVRRKNYHSMIQNQMEVELKQQNDDEDTNVDYFSHTKDEKKETAISNTFRVINIILKFIFFMLLLGLLSGAIVIGNGYIKYPPRGTFSRAKLADEPNRQLKIHHLCEGPKNDSLPVFLFDGSGSHMMLDYFGLQKYLTQNRRRSCIWDLPGQGYSDYMFSSMKNFDAVYANLIESLGERGPYVLVGWGGGGQSIYKYAASNPEMVHSLVFLDVAPDSIEFKIPSILKNWTQSQYDAYKRSELAARRSTFNLINSIGVPFGLMGIFIPREEVISYPTEFVNENRWFFLSDKTWSTQEHLFKHLFDVNVFEEYKIDQRIPINAFVTTLTDQQVINQMCKDKPADSDDCKYEIASNRILTEEREKLVNLTQGGGKIVRCTNDKCGLGYWVKTDPLFTVLKLLELYN